MSSSCFFKFFKVHGMLDPGVFTLPLLPTCWHLYWLAVFDLLLSYADRQFFLTCHSSSSHTLPFSFRIFLGWNWLLFSALRIPSSSLVDLFLNWGQPNGAKSKHKDLFNFMHISIIYFSFFVFLQNITI